MDRDKVLLQAQKLVDKKRYDKAIAEYQKLVVDDPSDVRTMLKIGDLHLKMEGYVDAITTYERVGDYYHKQGFALKAIAVYKQIREIVHKYVPHLEDRFGHIVPRLADIYTQLGLTSDALAAYDEVATRLQRAGRDRDAIDIFRRVVDLDPQNPLPHLRLAEAYIRVKDVDTAIERFGAAASILLRLGRPDDALKVVERLLMHRPDPRFAKMAAEIYLGRGDPNDGMAALTKLQICFKQDSKDLETLALLARTFDHLGQPAKAIEVHKEAARIAKESGTPDQFAELVELLQQRAPHDEAVKNLASVLHAMRAPPPPEPPSLELEEAVSVEVDDVEIIEDEYEEVEVESEEPIALRQSRPPAMDDNDPVVVVRTVLTQVEQLRRQRHYPPAINALKNAIRELPAFRELRERLCDLLIESGDQDGAIEQMIAHARHLSDSGDTDGSARILDEVLLLEPDHAVAMSMLGSLGYAVPEPSMQPPSSSYANEAVPVGFQGNRPAPPPYPAPDYDPNEPLPSYDLEEVQPAQALAVEPPAVPIADLDDPFSVEPDAPLPSFPIDERSLDDEGSIDRPFAPPPASARLPLSAPATTPTGAAVPRQGVGLPGLGLPAPGAPPVAPPAGVAPMSMRPAEGQLDEDALEEIEFFMAHGMLEEAQNILTEQLARLPNHVILVEKQDELNALVAAAASQSGERELPQDDEDRSFDIAASLEALDALEVSAVEAPVGLDDQISVETVFEQFKAGVAAQVPESDSQTHYDLGVAYKEMGLLVDAISEMELASRDPARECVCQSMIGSWHLETGNVEAAIDAFLRGLHAPQKDQPQELALTYEIGNAYELRNQKDQALYYFQRVAHIDPGYRDPRGSVEDRIARLEPPKAAPTATKAAVGAAEVVDEFDAAFDELLGGDSKLP